MSEVSITRLVDTSIVIDFPRGSEIAKNWLNSFQAGELAISVVTAAELVAGCRNRREQNKVEKDLTFYPMLWVSSATSSTAWDLYRQYHLSDGVGFLDCLIGATAYQHGIMISTLNEKHFRPFPSILVERPY
jgi:predicted nucleic acid-binding protein